MNAQYFSAFSVGRWTFDVGRFPTVFGGVAERLIAPVLKTGRPKGLVSSNLTPSATLIIKYPNFAFFVHDPGIFMSYWYGGLYAVIEGWQELGLTDPTIDRLLESPNVELLRRYRNGVFHYQMTYFDDRFRLNKMKAAVQQLEEQNRRLYPSPTP